MRLSVQEILIIAAVIVAVFFVGKVFVGRQKNAKAKKASSTSKSSSSSSSKSSGNAVQTLRYAAIAFVFVGAILLLAASQIAQYSMYMYIGGGVFVGAGLIFFFLSVKAKK